MTRLSPALVAQAGVRRLPRWGLLLFCAIYVLAGFIGRAPWRHTDAASFGYMLDLAQGKTTSWLTPGLFSGAGYFDALLPYWIGSLSIQATSGWLDPFVAVRAVSVGMLCLTLLAVWYAIYYLARSPEAQPVSFAFGGEAKPKDYARALADGGLLAFMACLGLAEQAHGVGPALYQLCFAAMLLYALAALPYRLYTPALFGVLGMVGLTLSGAPVVAVFFGIVGVLAYATKAQDWNNMHESMPGYAPDPSALHAHQQKRLYWIVAIVLLTVLCTALAVWLNLWHWRMAVPHRWVIWRDLIKLHLWFTWPVWPFVFWTLWHWRAFWRRNSPNRHLALPLAITAFCAGGGWISTRPDVMLLLSLPALSALAAFALPTFKRSVGAFIDWFTLLFFTIVAGYLWVLWSAMQLGSSASITRTVSRKLQGYDLPFEWLPFLAAIAVSIGWLGLVRWRTKRLQPAIWKSMILPAGGVLLCWTLATTLWMPALNFARSFQPMASGITQLTTAYPAPQCFASFGLSYDQRTALTYHLHTSVLTGQPSSPCNWLLVQNADMAAADQVFHLAQWQRAGVVGRDSSSQNAVVVFRRVAP